VELTSPTFNHTLPPGQEFEFQTNRFERARLFCHQISQKFLWRFWFPLLHSRALDGVGLDQPGE